MPPRELGRLLDQLPIGIVSIDRERRVRLLNRNATATLGVRARDVTGRPAASLFRGAGDALAAALRGERGPHLVRAVRHDGERWLELRVTGYTPAGDDPVTLLLLQDVTARVGAERAVRESQELLTAVTDSTSDVLFVKDADGRFVMLNRTGAAHVGRTPERCAGLHMRELYEPESAERLLADDRVVMESGETREFEEHVSPLDGQERVYLATKSPHRDADGRIVGVVGVARDITDRRRSEERLRVLATAGELLGGSLHYASTLPAVARAVVPAVADGCLIDMVGSTGELEPLAVVHADPVWEQAARGAGTLPVAAAALRGGARCEPEVDPSAFAAGAAEPEQRAALERLAPRSLVVVPLSAAGARPVGTLTLVTGPSGRRLDEQDLRFAQDLGRRAATAVAHARLHAERSQIARTLQDSLLPPRLPALPRAGVASRFHAAGASHGVGGDFYDLVPLPDGRFLLVIGDVCGKGPEAAAVTALARYTIRGTAVREHSPAVLLGTLNEALVRQDIGGYCSVLCARLEPRADGLDIVAASAGHPLALLLRAAGGGEEAGVRGPLLGVEANPRLIEAGARLEPGDTALFYTDGVTEAGGRSIALTRLIELAAPWSAWGAEAVASRVEAAALGAGGEDLHDDVALVAVSLPPVVRPERLRIALGTEATLGRAVRSAVEPLRDRIGRQAFATVRLLVDELVANAERHGTPDAGAPIGLEVTWDDERVRVSVSDSGPGFDPPRRPLEPSGSGGWGLLAVDRLARAWGVDRSPPATVWVEVAR